MALPLSLRSADHRSLEIAHVIHGVQMLAYAQEVALLGVPCLPPQQLTVEQVRASDECFTAAWLSSTLVGAVGVIDKPDASMLVISSLVVHPAHQRAGIATRLLLRVLAASDAASVRVSTGAGNEPALALYLKHGFVEYKRWFVGPEPLELLALKLERASAAKWSSPCADRRDFVMTSPKLKVGQPITPDQFDELSDEQLARLVPKAYREFFPGKDFCADGHFYLHDGTAWCFYRGGFLDEQGIASPLEAANMAFVLGSASERFMACKCWPSWIGIVALLEAGVRLSMTERTDGTAWVIDDRRVRIRGQ